MDARRDQWLDHQPQPLRSREVELLRGVGAEASDRLLLQSHSQSTELKNKTKVSPRPAANVPAHCESVRITELLKLLEATA